MKNLEYLLSSVENINGIGNYLSVRLKKLGINRIIDLLLYIPINLINYTFNKNLSKIDLSLTNSIPLKIIAYKNDTNNFNKKPFQVIATDNFNKYVIINFFNYYSIKYIKNRLPINSTKIISGKFEIFNNYISITHPEILEDVEINKVNKKERIYKATEGLSSKRIATLIKQISNDLLDIPEWLDQSFLKIEKLPSFKEAILNIHFNDNFELNFNNKSLQRLAIDEILAYQIYLTTLRKNKIQQGKKMLIYHKEHKLLCNSLDFKLTNGQLSAIEDIYKDMSSNTQMIRIIEGDVGSGKTIIALFSALLALNNNYQVAFMVPTENLALQHFHTLLKYKELLKYNVSYLTGSEKVKKRKEIISELKSNKINILVGTHAIFQDDVIFNNLGLVIIDEQHRFGVLQRLALISKSNNPHILLLSATPIPRTLALAYYGDISISELRDKPLNRKTIITKSISKSKIDKVIERVSHAVNNNEKIFWVCPLIEENEKLHFTATSVRYNELIKKIPKDLVLFLHGKMKSSEKIDILNHFRNLKKGILVSTTVIEVGIDIPDANIMIIEHANQFGLAQLHQLRGRVGRGNNKGYCLLIYDDNISIYGKKRMQVMENSTDGFYIAEQDYILRGSGDILGLKQSGVNPFKIANLEVHSNFIKAIKTYCNILLNSSEDEIKIKVLLNIFNHNVNINQKNIFYNG